MPCTRPRVCVRCGDPLPPRVRLYCDIVCNFLSKTERQEDGCLNWTGNRTHQGYGGFAINAKRIYAHRAAYILFVGPIPEGMVLDHLCRNPSCVNPDHLEPVTSWENTLRGLNPVAAFALATHCIHGHEFTPENTRNHKGVRHCRACCRERRRAYEQRKAS